MKLLLNEINTYLESKRRIVFYNVLGESRESCVLSPHERSSSQTNCSTQSRTITSHSSLFLI